MLAVVNKGRIEFLEWQLAELLGDLDAAREANSHQAIAALWRRVTDTRADLDACRSAVPESDQRTPAEVVREMADVIAAAPAHLLGPIYEAVDRKRGGGG